MLRDMRFVADLQKVGRRPIQEKSILRDMRLVAALRNVGRRSTEDSSMLQNIRLVTVLQNVGRRPIIEEICVERTGSAYRGGHKNTTNALYIITVVIVVVVIIIIIKCWRRKHITIRQHTNTNIFYTKLDNRDSFNKYNTKANWTMCRTNKIQSKSKPYYFRKKRRIREVSNESEKFTLPTP